MLRCPASRCTCPHRYSFLSKGFAQCSSGGWQHLSMDGGCTATLTATEIALGLPNTTRSPQLTSSHGIGPLDARMPRFQHYLLHSRVSQPSKVSLFDRRATVLPKAVDV